MQQNHQSSLLEHYSARVEHFQMWPKP